MTVRDFIALMSKPENEHLLDTDLGIEMEHDDYYDVQNVYLSTLVATDDDADSASAVTLSPDFLPVGKDEKDAGTFYLERRKIV